MNGCFVTGTDTDVGKTCVSAALLHALAQAGVRCAGFKPVAAGIDAQGVNDDVRVLRAAGSVPLTDAEVGPCQLRAACAPHIAAALEGRVIDRALLLQAAQVLASRVDFLVVEGAGGFCVPLGAAGDMADLACDLGLPVVLVVGLRLGCLNHALLTAHAIAARGLRLAGWVGNAIDPRMPYRDHNTATLGYEFGERRQVPCLGLVPWLDAPNAASMAAHLDGSTLHSALTPPLHPTRASA
jgi:dethiobiotin synthetase